MEDLLREVRAVLESCEDPSSSTVTNAERRRLYAVVEVTMYSTMLG